MSGHQEGSIALPPEGEWIPTLEGWILLGVRSGTGYWLGPGSGVTLDPGDLLVVSSARPGSLRASLLGPLKASCRGIGWAEIRCVANLREVPILEALLRDEAASVLRFTATDPRAVRFAELDGSPDPNGFTTRLRWMAFWGELVELEKIQKSAPGDGLKGVGVRFRRLIERLPCSGLAEMTSENLAQLCGCSTRHFGRLFRRHFGISFRERRRQLQSDEESVTVTETSQERPRAAISCPESGEK